MKQIATPPGTLSLNFLWFPDNRRGSDLVAARRYGGGYWKSHCTDSAAEERFAEERGNIAPRPMAVAKSNRPMPFQMRPNFLAYDFSARKEEATSGAEEPMSRRVEGSRLPAVPAQKKDSHWQRNGDNRAKWSGRRRLIEGSING